MRRGIAFVTLAMSIALPFGPVFGAAATGSHGTKGSERMSDRGQANTNAQWSADPDRGWVRADERNRLREQIDTPHEKRNQGHQKGKAKSKKL